MVSNIFVKILFIYNNFISFSVICSNRPTMILFKKTFQTVTLIVSPLLNLFAINLCQLIPGHFIKEQ